MTQPPTLNAKQLRVALAHFEALVDLDLEQQQAGIAAIGDSAVASELIRLLAMDIDSAQLQTARLNADDLRDDQSFTLETSLGSYQIGEEIGSGGMGTVYRAERSDAQFTKSVAVKIISHHHLDRTAQQRIQREKQILANLEHPGIARLIDAGSTEQGQSFTIMELIDGQPITEYASQHALDLSARVDLFMQLCEAVRHAHQHLILHQDLKPGNILVDQNNQVKLLDFGIARLMEDSGSSMEQTQLTRGLMTPAYASPEQLQQRPTGVQSDVYSLGILLYELLTGSRPYQIHESDTGKLIEAIEQHTIELPSQRLGKAESQDLRIWPSQLSGDLDSIIGKALEAGTEARYQSVDRLLNDLHNYQDGTPVSAARQNTWYRTRRLIQRNRGISSLLGLLFLALIAFGVTASLQNSRLISERDIAQGERDKARAVTGVLIDAFKSADPTRTKGVDVTAREILEQTGESLKPLKLTDQQLYFELSTIVSDVYEAINDRRKAMTHLRNAYETNYSATLAVSDQTDLLLSLGRLATINRDIREAEQWLSEAQQNISPRSKEMVRMLTTQAQIASTSGDFERSRNLWAEVLELNVQLPGSPAQIFMTKNGLMRAESRLGNNEARHAFAREVSQELDLENLDSNIKLDIVFSAYNVLKDEGQYEEALDLLNKTKEIISSRLGPEHYDISRIDRSIGVIYSEMGENDLALEHTKHAFLIRSQLLDPDAFNMITLTNNLATMNAAAGLHDEAERLYLEAISNMKKDNPEHAYVGLFLNNYIRFKLNVNQFDEIQPALDEALAINLKRNAKRGRNIAISRLLYANHHILNTGESGLAAELIELALPIFEREYKNNATYMELLDNTLKRFCTPLASDHPQQYQFCINQ